MLDVALKYWTYALVACCAAVNSPGTGPLMSEELPRVMVLSVMPFWFLKPAHEPALMPEPAGGLLPPPPVPSLPSVPGVPASEPGAVPPSSPATARFASSTSLGLSSDPPHAAGTRSANARAHAPTNLLRTAELLTPVCDPRTGPTSHNGPMWRRLHRSWNKF